MLSRKIVVTADGSKTLWVEQWDESYHSKHGALQEAMHVFIQNGLHRVNKQPMVRVLEFGFGTGLNALLCMLDSYQNKQSIVYYGAEKHPVLEEEFFALNYFDAALDFYPELKHEKVFLRSCYDALQQTEWEKELSIHDYFVLNKQNIDFFDLQHRNCFDLVFFDCFGARVQPDLWDETLFSIAYNALQNGGILSTYAAKGSARRALEAVGFSVSKLPGPPGKREMMVAKK